MIILAFLSLFLAFKTFYVGFSYESTSAMRQESHGDIVRQLERERTELVVQGDIVRKLERYRTELVVQRILDEMKRLPELSFSHLLRAELVCSDASSSPCPLFHPNIHKFEAIADEIKSISMWSKASQSAALRNISLQMWYEKRMDIAAARVLGCAVLNGSVVSSAYDKPEESIGTNGLCRSHQQINLLLPLVFHTYRGRFINRTEYLLDSQSNEWYQSFGYNPLKISDSRLAYEAPAFTQEDWMKMCFMEVARQSKTYELPQPQSRAWYACSSFAASTRSKHYHYGMQKCFDVPPFLLAAGATQLAALLSTYGSHREYVEQCRGSHQAISDDPWSLRQLSRDVFNVLRDRWDLVQSVYELAIYESNRDIQRSDEYVEALQSNTCNPDVQALHLFIENDAVTSYFHSLKSGSFHDPCQKLRSVFLGKRMHYKDALIEANRLAGQTVMITNADIVLAQGFDSMPELNSFLKENNRLFALSRHERPAAVFATLCRMSASFDPCCFRDFLIVILVAMKPDMMAATMHLCTKSRH